MACKCGSERIANVTAKCSDMCCIDFAGTEYDGYVPDDMGIGDGSGDYVTFSYCLDCGTIQGQFPLPPTSME